MTSVATMQHHRAILTLAAIAALGVSAPARSGGMSDEEADRLMSSNAIVGFVKDAAGNTVADAKVVVTLKSGNADITRSDATGHFRIPGLSIDLTADGFELTCSKTGYRQTASLKRPSAATSANAPIEVACVLTHE